jgi:hypothetical protein
MTQRRSWKPLGRCLFAGGLGLGVALAGSLASAENVRGLGRSQPHFGSSLDRSGASGFVPDRRPGNIQRGARGAKLGDTRDQPDRMREDGFEDGEPRGLKFDDHRQFRSSSDEGLVSRGRDHRGAPANRRSPFFPGRNNRLLQRELAR